MDPTASLGLPPPPQIWGIFTRLLGLVYLVAFGSLSGQVLGLAGARGITPVGQVLRKISTDYRAPWRWLLFPTLLWFGSSDRALRGLVLTGAAAALFVVIGGPCSGPALLACWALYLSLDVALDLVYPWDSLLLEAGFLALFLPPLLLLPEVAATAPASPQIAWCYRWLLFRLMFGFGKQKFLGSTWADLDYLKSFFINQPMPTALGWYAHRLPLFVLKPALVAMFLLEVPGPFLVFFTGWPRLLAALLTAGLMLVIQLVGNYGFFNLLSLALCVTLLDDKSSLFDTPLPPSATPGQLVESGVAFAAFVGGLLYLPFNHWCTRTFLDWQPLVDARSLPLRALFAFYRALSPFRVLHSYGVFPPHSGPPARVVPILEGSLDGETWHEYDYRRQPSKAQSPPTLTAPGQPRLDYSLAYEALGHNHSGLFCSLSGTGNPYRFSHEGPMDRLVERLLEGSPPVLALLGKSPFPAGSPAPKAIRVHLCMLTPASPSERARTGQWWTRRPVGVHLFETRRRETLWDSWLLDPELFHWDHVLWKRRAPALQALVRWNGGDPLAALTSAAGVSGADVAAFWEELIPIADGVEWERLPEVVARLRERFDDAGRRRLERTLGRLALLLSARLEPHFRGAREPRLALPSFFHLGLLVHHIILKGRAAYERALAEPGHAAELASDLTVGSGLYCPALFWFETLRFHAWKIRMIHKSWGKHTLDSPLRGVTDVYPFLSQQFAHAQEQAMPWLHKIAPGEWRIERDAPHARA